jgi:Protein of unknown function (DUF2726)
MLILQIVVALLVVGVLVWFWMRGREVTHTEQKEADRIDTLIGWPPQPTRVLTNQERVVFGTLVRALPEYMVLAQVPLARFISVPKRNSYADWLRRLGYQCADFVVCDMAAQVVAVIELSRTLKAADISLHVWSEDAVPAVAAVRETILPRLNPAAEALPTTARHPLEDHSLDSIQTETIELLEPPASTWFDDLDTAPAPLSKNVH